MTCVSTASNAGLGDVRARTGAGSRASVASVSNVALSDVRTQETANEKHKRTIRRFHATHGKVEVSGKPTTHPGGGVAGLRGPAAACHLCGQQKPEAARSGKLRASGA
jgi:hypothetical protein